MNTFTLGQAERSSGAGFTRPAAHAGRFYPDQPDELRREIEEFLRLAPFSPGPAPKAIIAPHAGYLYSGPVAGTAYAVVAAGRKTIHRVALLGPAHYAEVPGIALSSAVAFATPLGRVPVDVAAVSALRRLPGVDVDDRAHAPEHSLEVHLPFLQTVLEEFALVPLLVGRAADDQIAAAMEAVWDEPGTLIVVSSDLSHFHDYHTAGELDAHTADRIVALRGEELGCEDACGCRPIRGLLRVARARGWRCHLLDLRNSGDTAGPRQRVVGYGAFAFA
ncbi:MAG: AmmeMemoRadiSam system protein B [Verrucomicrobia bacterium]|nr:AmmeMemoRadiSam system protein B [Verrucomicrobiota bacterium]